MLQPTTARTEILETSVSQILEDSTPTQEWTNEGHEHEPHWHESANRPTISNKVQISKRGLWKEIIGDKRFHQLESANDQCTGFMIYSLQRFECKVAVALSYWNMGMRIQNEMKVLSDRPVYQYLCSEVVSNCRKLSRAEGIWMGSHFADRQERVKNTTKYEK